VVAWSYLVRHREEKTQNRPEDCDEEKKWKEKDYDGKKDEKKKRQMVVTTT
jgi:hypothetical protein